MFDSLVDGFSTAFSAVQTEIYIRIVQPALFATGLMPFADDAFDGVQFFLIGVIQIVLMLVLLRPLEALAPAEQWRERLLVSPAFHRRHHAIGAGHEGRHGGCNFGMLFPWWDMPLGTADFSHAGVATGIRDQLPPPAGRLADYGEGLWAQQWLGLRRLWASVLPRRPGASDSDPASRTDGTDRTESA